MDTKNQFGKNIIASLLLMFLLLPTVFQFVSVFEDHEHVVCSEQQVHVHKSIVDCEICSFHFTPLNYNLDKKNFCMAQKERNNRYCSYIQNMDNSSYCYAIVDNDSRRCHYIKNNDTMQFCLSNF